MTKRKNISYEELTFVICKELMYVPAQHGQKTKLKEEREMFTLLFSVKLR